MSQIAMPRAQRGATLVVGLIMLVIITLVVTSAFMMSNSNLKSVGNMQVRNEAIAAANAYVETILSTLDATKLAGYKGTGSSTPVTIGGINYTVVMAPPVCIRASIAGTGSLSSLSLPGMSSSDTWNTVWDIEVSVSDAASGANVEVHQGTRILLSDSDKQALCP